VSGALEKVVGAVPQRVFRKTRRQQNPSPTRKIGVWGTQEEFLRPEGLSYRFETRHRAWDCERELRGLLGIAGACLMLS
jgi:hypothetical protein